MYAVLSSGGKQYRVEPGTTLVLERIAGARGASITFDRVLLVADGEDVMVGTPTVEGAIITGTILRDERGPKIVVFKFKQKVKYRRRTGHRQHLVRVRIDEISANGRSARAEVAESEQRDALSKVTTGQAERRTTGKTKSEKPPAASEPEKPKARRAKAAKAEDASADSHQAAAHTEEKPKARSRAAKPRAKADEADKE